MADSLPVLKRLHSDQLLLIDGTWCASKNGLVKNIYNPSKGEKITQVAVASSEDVERAVASARKSFDQGGWKELTPTARTEILWKIADLIEENAAELAELEALNTGKHYGTVQHSDVPFAAKCFRYYAGWCDKIEGAQISALDCYGFHAYTRREPVGVVALIIPWNNPLTQAAMKLAPALAVGCSCILKPPLETPLSIVKLGELMIKAGLPAGAVSILFGDAAVGELLAQHPDVDKISFTGSTETGRKVVAAAAGNLKKVSLELGGKSPFIIFEDANLEKAIPSAAEAIFTHAGQTCVAGSRLYAHESVFDEVIQSVSKIAETTSKAMESKVMDTECGPTIEPLVSEHHRNYVRGMLSIGKQEGARFITGDYEMLDGEGFFLKPTVLTDVNHTMRVVNEEIFGPVLVVMSFSSEAEVVSYANDTGYGLAASIWTSDISRAQRVAAAMKAGLVGINCHGVGDVTIPFGGYKKSGWGRENGFESIIQYTELKSVVMKLI